LPHIPTAELARNLSESSAQLNEAYARANNAVILKNILRTRDDWPTSYTTLSGVTSTPELVAKASGTFTPLGLGNPPNPFGGSSATLSADNTAALSYNVSPASQENKEQGVYRPIPVNIFSSYWNAGTTTDRKLLWTLLIDSSQQPDDEIYESRIIVQKRPEEECPTIAKFSKNDLITNEKLSDQLKKFEETVGAQTHYAVKNGDVHVHFCKEFHEYVFENGSVGVTSSSEEFLLFAENSFKLRTLDGAVRFVGKAIRKKSDNRTVHENVNSENCITQPPNSENIFSVVRKGALGNLTGELTEKYAASTRHAGDLYFAARRFNAQCKLDFASEVLTILTQLYLRSQSDEFLKAPESTILRTQ